MVFSQPVLPLATTKFAGLVEYHDFDCENLSTDIVLTISIQSLDPQLTITTQLFLSLFLRRFFIHTRPQGLASQ